jgi:hypothetical protein
MQERHVRFVIGDQIDVHGDTLSADASDANFRFAMRATTTICGAVGIRNAKYRMRYDRDGFVEKVFVIDMFTDLDPTDVQLLAEEIEQNTHQPVRVEDPHDVAVPNEQGNDDDAPEVRA